MIHACPVGRTAKHGPFQLAILLLYFVLPAMSFTTPAPAPSLPQNDQTLACGPYLDIHPSPEADLADQRDALLELFTAVSHEPLILQFGNAA